MAAELGWSDEDIRLAEEAFDEYLVEKKKRKEQEAREREQNPNPENS